MPHWCLSSGEATFPCLGAGSSGAGGGDDDSNSAPVGIVTRGGGCPLRHPPALLDRTEAQRAIKVDNFPADAKATARTTERDNNRSAHL